MTSIRCAVALLCTVVAVVVAPSASAAKNPKGIPTRHHINTSSEPIYPMATCAVTPIFCNTSVTDSLKTSDCLDNFNSYVHNYTFSGTAGQTVTIDLTSPNPGADIIDPFLDLYAPDGTPIAENDDANDNTLNARIQAVLPVSGTYIIAASNAEPRDTGEYTLSLACSSASASCTPSATALCLNNNRFRVEARWQDSNFKTGNGTAVALTGDSGYFWFFNSANIELVVKALDACGVNSRFWVFSAGLTNVQVTLTVTDTKSGQQKQYINPLNTAYQPIQDTGAFATCNQ